MTILIPDGLSFTRDDIPYLGHRHSTFRSFEETRVILEAHGCESSYEAQDLPQPQLNALCFAFVVAMGSDNHPSLLEQPQMSALCSTLGWQPQNNPPIATSTPDSDPNLNPEWKGIFE